MSNMIRLFLDPTQTRSLTANLLMGFERLKSVAPAGETPSTQRKAVFYLEYVDKAKQKKFRVFDFYTHWRKQVAIRKLVGTKV